MYSNTDSTGNIGIGYFALRDGSGGSSRDYNIAIGQEAMRSGNSHVSIAIGYYAGKNIKEGGSGIVTIGHEAGAYSTGSNNTFMGYQAGRGKRTQQLLTTNLIIIL